MASLADLPEDVIFHILQLCAIEAALTLTRTCKAIYLISTMRGFWLSIISSLRRRRPVPVDDRRTDVAGLRSVALESLRLHHKLSVRHNMTFIRYIVFPRVMTKEHDGRIHRNPWVILLKDGKSLLQIIRQMISIRNIRTTELLAQIMLNGDVQSLGHQLTDRGIFLTLCLWHPWRESNSSVEVWHLDNEVCIVRQPLDYVPLDIVIYEHCSYYTVKREQDDAILLYISNWETLTTSVFDISAALPGEPFQSAVVTVTRTKILLHLSLRTETRLISFSHTSLRSHIHPASSTPSICNCPAITPEWALCSPFGPKPLWTVMNTAWDGRIGVIVSAIPSAHVSGMSQKIILCQFDAEARGSDKANLEDGLVSRRAEVVESLDGRHVLNPGRYGKTVAWCYRNARSDVDLPGFFFADRRGTDPDDPAEAESVFSKYGISDDTYTYRFNPPAWVAMHGRMLDMDFDDGRGRLALAMEDDTTVLFEF